MSLPTRVIRPVDPFEAVQREFDSVLGRLFSGTANGGMLAPYAVDVRETPEQIIVEAELPGFTKDQIEVTLENGVLTLSADRSQERTEGQPGDYLIKERRYTRFQRSFTLPPTVDESTVNAKHSDGVLTVTLNKRAEAKPRKISVS